MLQCGFTPAMITAYIQTDTVEHASVNVTLNSEQLFILTAVWSQYVGKYIYVCCSHSVLTDSFSTLVGHSFESSYRIRSRQYTILVIGHFAKYSLAISVGSFV